jgi:hypothetical protein
MNQCSRSWKDEAGARAQVRADEQPVRAVEPAVRGIGVAAVGRERLDHRPAVLVQESAAGGRDVAARARRLVPPERELRIGKAACRGEHERDGVKIASFTRVEREVMRLGFGRVTARATAVRDEDRLDDVVGGLGLIASMM